MTCIQLADKERDILSVRVAGMKVVTSDTLPGDLNTILNYDGEGNIVGVQVIGAFTCSRTDWARLLRHPELPSELVSFLTAWAKKER